MWFLLLIEFFMNIEFVKQKINKTFTDVKQILLHRPHQFRNL